MSTALTEARAIQLANEYAQQPAPQQDQKRRDLVAAVVLWLASNGPDLAAVASPLMAGIIADGWLIGAASAQALTSGTGRADTGTWQPGGTQAATTAAGALGLAAQLATATSDKASAEAGQQVAGGYAAAIARALIDGTAAGQAAKQVAQGILGVLKDAARAAGAALGQLVDAIGAAAGKWYLQQQVMHVQWLTDPASNVCPACEANEAQGPIPLGTPFPSGDTEAPAHDRCRCGVIPATEPEGARVAKSAAAGPTARDDRDHEVNGATLADGWPTPSTGSLTPVQRKERDDRTARRVRPGRARPACGGGESGSRHLPDM